VVGIIGARGGQFGTIFPHQLGFLIGRPADQAGHAQQKYRIKDDINVKENLDSQPLEMKEGFSDGAAEQIFLVKGEKC
jgi:hypothetical protein